MAVPMSVAMVPDYIQGRGEGGEGVVRIAPAPPPPFFRDLSSLSVGDGIDMSGTICCHLDLYVLMCVFMTITP